MNLEEVRIIKSDDRGIIYDCGKSSFITRKKGAISADHNHSDEEILFLVRGEIELTVGDETKNLKAPIKIAMPPNVYHKLVALTDIDLVIDREGEK